MEETVPWKKIALSIIWDIILLLFPSMWKLMAKSFNVKENSLFYNRRSASTGQWHTSLQNWLWLSLRVSLAFLSVQAINAVKAFHVTEKSSCVEVWGVPLAHLQCTASPKFIVSRNCTCFKSSVLLHLKTIQSCFLHFVYLVTPIQESMILPG